MAIRVQRFPEHRLNLHIFSGVITVEEVLEHIRKQDVTVRWLCFFAPTVDLSEIDLAHVPDLRRSVSLRERERADLPTAIVTTSGSSDPVLRFWRDYASAEPHNPHEPVLFDNLEAACRWLGLPAAAQDRIAAEIAAPETSAHDAS